MRARAGYPVRHVWQPHDGFRAGRARNAAIARAHCEYLVLLDGDMVCIRNFSPTISHSRVAGYYSQGVRILLDAAATARLLAAGQFPARPAGRPASAAFVAATRCAARGWPASCVALRTPWSPSRPATRGSGARICVRANGFDEALTGWGAEDKELCARLEHAGVRRQTLLFAALAWHLDHPPASRARARREPRPLAGHVAARAAMRCEAGIDRSSSRLSIATFPSGAAPGPLL